MPAAKSWIDSSEERVKVQNSDTVMDRLGKVPIDRELDRTMRKQSLAKSISKKKTFFKADQTDACQNFLHRS